MGRRGSGSGPGWQGLQGRAAGFTPHDSTLANHPSAPDHRCYHLPPLSSCRKQVHNVGLHGEGKECWWALRVKAGREKQVRK